MSSVLTDKDMEWTSNIQNERVAFMPTPHLESNSSNSLHSFVYDPYAGGNQYQHAYKDTAEPVIGVPEKMMNSAYQCPNTSKEMTKKIRRVTNDQLALLEQSFQDDIKLDLDRKLKLSKELGLQPRQVAVWFQNRRARWKVKHLEESYDSLRLEYDVISREKQMLQDEVKKLRAILLRDQGLMKTQSNLANNSATMVGSSCWLPISQPYTWCNFANFGESQRALD